MDRHEKADLLLEDILKFYEDCKNGNCGNNSDEYSSLKEVNDENLKNLKRLGYDFTHDNESFTITRKV